MLSKPLNILKTSIKSPRNLLVSRVVKSTFVIDQCMTNFYHSSSALWLSAASPQNRRHPPPPPVEAPSRSQVDEPSTRRRLRPMPPPPPLVRQVSRSYAQRREIPSLWLTD